MFTWGRKMSRKLDILRRHDIQVSKSATSSPSKSSSFSIGMLRRSKGGSASVDSGSFENFSKLNSNNDRTQSPIRTFFHRIGSTGMLSSKHSNSNSKEIAESSHLYRSSSTSQLNTISYIKCDDPTEGVEGLDKNTIKTQRSLSTGATGKSSSYDDITRVTEQAKRGHFPYAFLRSKLSVLPEENNGSVINQKRARASLGSEFPASFTPMNIIEPDTVSLHEMIIHRDSIMEECSPMNETHEFLMNRSSSDSSSSSTSSEENNRAIISRKSSTSSKEYEPIAYQRLSSCISSNESGYDSDSRHENMFITDGEIVLNKSKGRRRISSTGSITSPTNPDCGTIRRRFRQVKLEKKNPSDKVGVVLTRQMVNLGDCDTEMRYYISEIDPEGIAFR